jgi:transglutaminase-like putative cysteine protease
LRAHILHTTDYRYPEDASNSFNELRLQPADDDRQTVLEFSLSVEAYARASKGRRLVRLQDVTLMHRRDYYGTNVHHAHISQPHRHLRVQTRSIVITQPTPQPLPTPAVSLIGFNRRWYEYLSATPRVPLEPDWPEVLGWTPPTPDTDLLDYLDGLTTHLHQRFSYVPGATSVHTPLEEFARQGEGVCQDYAHAMLGVCRKVGIPSRYVSGYLWAGQDFVGAEATHAWLECFVPGAGWLGFDPTNNVRVGESHVRIGHGRDYDDVPPIKGLRTGGGKETLGVEVSVGIEETELEMQIQQVEEIQQ